MLVLQRAFEYGYYLSSIIQSYTQYVCLSSASTLELTIPGNNKIISKTEL